MNVTKSNWELQEFSWEKIEAFYKRVNHWLNVKCPFSSIKENLSTYLVENISTEDINKMIVKSAIDLISTQNISWQNIAWRMTMRNLYKQWSRTNGVPHKEKYTGDRLIELISNYTARGLYNKKIKETYSEDEMRELAKEMKEEYDMSYIYGTVMMYSKRYLINIKGEIRELPQHLYLLNAMFLGINEKPEERIAFVKALYKMTTTGEISLPTPTLLNARTPNSQLSSCFIMTPADDLRSIYHNIEGMAQISKNWWGIGVYMGNIRSKGSFIKKVKGLSGGVMPWIKVINDTAIAVNQMGKRAWAISVTLDVFHLDIYDWLEMQTETGDIRSKAFDVFPAVSFPNLFMERVEANQSWSLFCPKEIEDLYWKRLQDQFGEDFVSFYEELEKDERIELKNVVEAKDLYKTYLKSVVETWMPYSFYRDTVNKLNPNKHCGSIYCTNLCCVTGDTRINTEHWLKTVEELYKTRELEATKVTTDRRTENLKLNEKWVVVRDSIWIYKTGNLQTYIVDTNSWYQLKATDYHKLYVKKWKKLEKLELKDIVVWDKLLIQSGKGQFGKDWNYEDWLIMWLVAWDGTYKSEEGLLIDLYNNDITEFWNGIISYINSIIPTKWSGGYQKLSHPSVIKHSTNSEKVRIGSDRMGRILKEEYGFSKSSKLVVPEKVFSGTEEMIRGYLQWIFATDWTIGNQWWWVQIQLTSIDNKMLTDIQILLSSFWIFSSIYSRNTKWKSTFSYTTKDWVFKEYKNKESYRLDVNWDNAKKFLEEWLIRWVKNERLYEYIKEHWPFNKKNFYTTITSIEKWEVEDVYDTTEAITNSVIFNWIVSGQCEIAQNQSENTFIAEEDDNWVITTTFQSGDTVICNLASINVAKVNTPENIARVVPIAMRTLDNVIDLNAYPIKETEISAKKYRAVGLWMMGLAQYFAENKIVYGSEDSVKATEVLFKEVAYCTLRASVDLAKQRWAYPMFKGSEFSKGRAFGKQLVEFEEIEENKWNELEEDMLDYWTRFGYHSSPAPNTSTWLVVGTTAGVVPVYKKYFVETNQVAPTVTVAPNLNSENFWFYKEYTSIELWGVIDVVSEIQKWIDQSVSFEWLINPQKTSPKDLYLYFFKAWRQGIKTVYYVRSQSLEIDTEACSSCTW